MPYIEAARVGDIPKRGLVDVEVDGHSLVLVATGDGSYYALEDECSHEDYPLSDGELLDDDRVECIYHGAKFDAKTGKAVALPAIRPVRTYDVKIEGDAILVNLE